MHALIDRHRDEILDLAARHGATNVRVFGSFARGEARQDSDLDLLVDMEPGRSLIDTIQLIQELGRLLGRKVDVLTEPALYWMVRRRILAEAKPL
ncbi:MAG: nucleotidyltransferase family protein [Fimbriimonadales bacterium]